MTSLHNVSCVRQRNTIGDASVGQDGVFAVATVVVHGLVELGALHLEECRQVTPAVIANTTLWEAAVERECALVENEVDVGGRATYDLSVLERKKDHIMLTYLQCRDWSHYARGQGVLAC